MPPLDKNTVLKELENLSDWKYSDNSITKTFLLDNFKSALAFVNNVGNLAEESDHHPNILMHDWNKVTINITTHSEGGVTQKDIALARHIEQSAS